MVNRLISPYISNRIIVDFAADIRSACITVNIRFFIVSAVRIACVKTRGCATQVIICIVGVNE